MEFISHKDEVEAELEKAIEKAMNAIGLHLEGEVKIQLENSPRRVDTGRLRNSITYATKTETHHEDDLTKHGPKRQSGTPAKAKDTKPHGTPEDRTVYVGTNVEYASYVHNGTKRMKANRFMKNAVEKNMDKCREIIRKCLEGDSP